MKPSETSNMYERLGIDENANDEEIKSAYKKAALQWHPDLNENKEISHIEFIAVSEAFEILSKKFDKNKYVRDYEPGKSSNKENTYEYYDELFRKIFKNSKFFENASPEIRTIIEIFKQFRR